MSSLLVAAGPSVLDRVSAALTEAAEERLWARSDDDVVARVEAALRVRAQADAVLLAAVGEVEARGLARARGASSTRAWLTGAHQVDPAEASVLVRTGTSLRAGFEASGAGLAAGQVSLSQARVIIRSVGGLPAEIGPELAAAGESLLVGYCQTFDPSALALIGRRLAECIDPEGTQARDEQKISEAELTAQNKRCLSLIRDKDGAGRYVRGYLSAEGAAIIAAALDGLSAPIPATAAGDNDTRSPAQRCHDGLVELCRRQIQSAQLPATGGIKPRIVITIPAHSWAERTGAGRLNDGGQISPSLAAYLGCDAEIIPAFLDQHGNLINLGRARRTFTGPARLALELRDRGCAWPGCDRPITWCEAHHILPWSKGGRTDQTNGVLLCGYHHREIEAGDWQVFIQGGRAWFRPPAWIDPQQTPILNPMHHPPPT
ncbi:MAG: DUF222 domain-containing protein [Geodermatophilaceae bacterium]